MFEKKVLLIDDDSDSLKMTGLIFHEAGAQAIPAQDGLDGMAKLFTQEPDLIILNVAMPGVDGFQICRRIRQYSNTPIIMLSSFDCDELMLQGLEAGADDFLLKPVNPEILLARSRTLLRRGRRRSDAHGDHNYKDGYLEIDIEKHRVLVNGQQIKLTPVEFRLLAYLASNEGRVLPFEQILFKVWGGEYQGNDDYVHVYVSHLRSKIEQDPKKPRYIVSIHGVGYIFEKQDLFKPKQVLDTGIIASGNSPLVAEMKSMA